MTLFQYGLFTSHSGIQLPYKIDCDALLDDDIATLARIISNKFLFSFVVGIPRGGIRLAEALKPYCIPNYPLLIVDDVLTTGTSMEEMRKTSPLAKGIPVIGVVIFARGPCPNWIYPMFIVQEWAQNRGPGIG